MNGIGFPHSDIPGSKRVYHSPGLIAAYNVLHRLSMPRYPPYARSSLTTNLFRAKDSRQRAHGRSRCLLRKTSTPKLIRGFSFHRFSSRELAKNATYEIVKEHPQTPTRRGKRKSQGTLRPPRFAFWGGAEYPPTNEV